MISQKSYYPTMIVIRYHMEGSIRTSVWFREHDLGQARLSTKFTIRLCFASKVQPRASFGEPQSASNANKHATFRGQHRYLPSKSDPCRSNTLTFPSFRPLSAFTDSRLYAKFSIDCLLIMFSAHLVVWAPCDSSCWAWPSSFGWIAGSVNAAASVGFAVEVAGLCGKDNMYIVTRGSCTSFSIASSRSSACLV